MKTSEQDNQPARLQRILKQLESDEDRAEFLSLYDGFKEDFNPVGPIEEGLVTHLALLSLRIRQCFYLQTDVIRRGMEATRTEGDDHDTAVGRAYIHDFQGANDLDKLSRQGSRLQDDRSRSLRRLRQFQEIRKRRQPKSAADTELELLKPYTSVVQ